MKKTLLAIVLALALVMCATPVLATPPDTQMSISTTTTDVSPGDSVVLTIEEYNSGAQVLESVYVELFSGFGTAGETLLETLYIYSASFVGGDTGIYPGWLEPGETWQWDVTVVVTEDTTYTAIGHGKVSADPPDITWPDYPDERDDITITVDSTQPGTTVVIEASAELVNTGDTINLFVTEENTGDVPLTGVQVVVNDGSSDIATLSAPPDSGDASNTGVLDPSEIWGWTIIGVIVNAETTYTATGYGIDPQGNPVTFPDYPDEQDFVTVRIDTNGGGEGLTPGYWKNHLGDWAATGYSPDDLFDDVFGVSNTRDAALTLNGAVRMRGGGERAMMRHAVAALLNSTHPAVDYEYTEAEVIAMVQDAYSSGDYEGVKDQFEEQNELGGDI